VCALHCAQLLRTILAQNRPDNFPSYHPITITPMMSIWGKGGGNCNIEVYFVSRPEVVRGDQTWLCVLDNVCFCCVRFSFFSTSRETGWEERLRNDLFLCEVGRKTLTQRQSPGSAARLKPIEVRQRNGQICLWASVEGLTHARKSSITGTTFNRKSRRVSVCLSVCHKSVFYWNG